MTVNLVSKVRSIFDPFDKEKSGPRTVAQVPSRPKSPEPSQMKQAANASFSLTTRTSMARRKIFTGEQFHQHIFLSHRRRTLEIEADFETLAQALHGDDKQVGD
jgi:hypothetical protein